MRDRFFTLAPLRITTLKEHLLQCFTDEEVNAVNESCYGKFALYRETHIVFHISSHKSQKWQYSNGRKLFVGNGISFSCRLCIQMTSSLHNCWLLDVHHFHLIRLQLMSKILFKTSVNVDSRRGFERKQQNRQGENMFRPFSLTVDIPVTLIKGHVWLACKHDFFFQSPALTFECQGKAERTHPSRVWRGLLNK